MRGESDRLILYAVDLRELEVWIGRRDEKALKAARGALREDEENEWEPEELEVLDGLLTRVVMEGHLYEGLPPRERYYLTQLLVEMFDEYVDSEAVSGDWPLDVFEKQLSPLFGRRDGAGRLAQYLLLGRELAGEATLGAKGQPLEPMYLGYVRHTELPVLVSALEEGPSRGRQRPPAAWKELSSACRQCVETERDLVSLVG